MNPIQPLDAGLSKTTSADREDELLASVGNGDRAAFSELYNRLAPPVLGLIRRTLIDDGLSHEVAQEVFLAVWQTAARFDATRGRARSFVLTMAHRRAVDRVRAAQAAQSRDLTHGIRELHPGYDTTYEAAEVSIEHQRARRALNRISLLQRETIWLRYHHGQTNAELAQILGVPLGTIKTRLRNGLINLRREMKVETV